MRHLTKTLCSMRHALFPEENTGHQDKESFQMETNTGITP